MTRRAEILETAGTLFAAHGLRTSLKQIADACGILPGSLYHHFESKEAIIAELVERYRADLDDLAAETLAAAGDEGELGERLVALGTAIAERGVRHRAAFLFTLFEPPPASQALDDAVLATLQTGWLRVGLDLPTFADRLCQVMLHSSLPVVGDVLGPDGVPAVRCRALLRGVAAYTPSDASLDRSAAFTAAQRTIDTWTEADDDEDARLPALRAAARAEFGRRGYDATTVRDIAKTAGMSVGSVYRLVGSKDELLGSVMGTFSDVVRAGWRNVLRTGSTSVEKLDALTWVNINAVHRFTDEYNIQLAFIREAPPTSVDVGSSFMARMRDLKTLLAQGTRAGLLAIEGKTADVRAWSLFELLWMPENIVARLGPKGALALARQTTLRGAGGREPWP